MARLFYFFKNTELIIIKHKYYEKTSKENIVRRERFINALV
jgi:hypothetical protein